MGNKTEIEWADATWNPVTGCLHGCPYCYARGIARRFQPNEQEDLSEISGDIVGRDCFFLRERARVKNRETGKDRSCPYPFGFRPTLHEYLLDEPKHWRKPRNIFVCSMADLFGDWAPLEWIEQVINACETAPQHQYLFLTKNPKRYDELHGLRLLEKKNIWLGTSATSNMDFNCLHYAEESVSLRFLSFEPLLDEISPVFERYLSYVEWVIIGAETGNRKNKVVPKREWVSYITRECNWRSIPVFMKDSLLPIMGEENMRREFPIEMAAVRGGAGRKW
jgi:protein gp37